MSNNINKLQKKIMRRVYYLYALRAARSLVTVQIVLFVGALFVFAKMVHVSKVIQNMLETSLGNVPQFIFNAFVHGEAITLLSIGVMLFVVFSLTRQVVPFLALRLITQRTYI